MLHTWLRGVVGCHHPLLFAEEELSVLLAQSIARTKLYLPW